MKKRLRYWTQLNGILFISLLLSACSIVPGMHMNTWALTPSLNQNGDAVTPQIIPITAQLIAQQQKEANIATALAIKNYVPPKGLTANPQSYQYRIGPQDVVDIQIWVYPTSGGMSALGIAGEATNTNAGTASSGDEGLFTVNAQGAIYYPYVGYIHIAGLTTDQARALLEQKLATILKDPQVTVQVKKFNSQTVTVRGAVTSPQLIPLTNVPMTVLEAVLKAVPLPCTTASAGVQPFCADLNAVTLSEDGVDTTVNLNTLTAVNGASVNWILDGDAQIYVPNNNTNTIFVLGAVASPGPYNMGDGHLSLKDALGTAGGVTDISDPTYTYVIRNYHSNPVIYELDAYSPDVFNLADEFMMDPQDVVFVSTSKLATVTQVLSMVNQPLTTAVYVRSLTQ